MDNIESLIEDQRRFVLSNRARDIHFRIENLKRFKQLVKDYEPQLYKAIYDDFGKSEYETFLTELALFYQEINHYIRKIPQWSRPQAVRTSMVAFPGKSYQIPEPFGITLIIGAWNYPYQLSLVPALCALAAGNTVVLKPSELPANTSAIMAKMINDTFPSDYFHVVEGGVDITTSLLNQRFDKIFFTGSIPVGKLVYQAAARHLTPVTLELGGKSPAFVFQGCNLQLTARRLVWAKFLNAGQTCVAPDYILVEKSIEKDLLEALKSEIQLQHPHQTFPADNYTRIINEKNFDRISSLIDHEKIFYGGFCDRTERYISPTILHQVSFDDKIMEDEIFGPVLPVVVFTNPDEAIQQVKIRPKPLSCYVYASDGKMVNRVLNEISFGGGTVNDSLMHLSNLNLPFGGVGHSGMGSYHGKAGFDTFTHYKSILEKSMRFEPFIKYLPYSGLKLKILKHLFGRG